MAPELPEDCYHLIKKAVSIRKHLERNRKDRDAKFRLILVESRIHRLARLSWLPFWTCVQESLPISQLRLGWSGPLQYYKSARHRITNVVVSITAELTI